MGEVGSMILGIVVLVDVCLIVAVRVSDELRLYGEKL